jgi:hypothetical protein
MDYIDNGLTETKELISILKWKYGFNKSQEVELECIKQIENHKGNWSIIFSSSPSVRLLLTIIVIFDSELSYDGLDFIQLNDHRIDGLAGCLSVDQVKKITQALLFCQQ